MTGPAGGLLAGFLVAALPMLALVETPDQQRARIDRLQNAILAPCCYMEPVARHQSDIAVRIRSEIQNWVRQGMSDREILDSYKQRYGVRVLIEPEGAAWWWAHLIPVFVLASGTALVVLLVRRWATPSDAQRPPQGTGALILPDLDED